MKNSFIEVWKWHCTLKWLQYPKVWMSSPWIFIFDLLLFSPFTLMTLSNSIFLCFTFPVFRIFMRSSWRTHKQQHHSSLVIILLPVRVSAFSFKIDEKLMDLFGDERFHFCTKYCMWDSYDVLYMNICIQCEMMMSCMIFE